MHRLLCRILHPEPCGPRGAEPRRLRTSLVHLLSNSHRQTNESSRASLLAPETHCQKLSVSAWTSSQRTLETQARPFLLLPVGPLPSTPFPFPSPFFCPHASSLHSPLMHPKPGTKGVSNQGPFPHKEVTHCRLRNRLGTTCQALKAHVHPRKNRFLLKM